MGKGGGSTTFGKGSNKSKSTTRIPTFLQPLINEGARIGTNSLTNLNAKLNNASGEDLVAGFNGAQELAQGIGAARALGADGFFPTAQNTVLDAAGGTDASQFIDPNALEALQSQSGAQGLDFLPDELKQALSLSSQSQRLSGADILGGLGDSALPSTTGQVLTADRTPQGTEALQGLLADGQVGQESLDALSATAGGDFLFGGDGFDQAVEAAVRASRPGLLSTFGAGGAGAATGGLAQTAIAQSGIDAFARQFANERRNQLSAAGTLEQLRQGRRAGSAGIASTLSSNDLADRRQDSANAETLARLTSADQQRRAGVGSTLAGLDLAQRDQDLNRNTFLSGLASANQDRALSAADRLAGIGQTERANQLDAAALLPQLATADIDLLNNIGGERQALAQERIDAPIAAQLQLMAAAMGVVPTESLLERRNVTRNRSFLQNFYGEGNFGADTPASSDARLKTNIRPAGTWHGFNVYEWDWNETARRLGVIGPTVGVLAQELESTHPDLVVDMPHGYKGVRYGALLRTVGG